MIFCVGVMTTIVFCVPDCFEKHPIFADPVARRPIKLQAAQKPAEANSKPMPTTTQDWLSQLEFEASHNDYDELVNQVLSQESESQLKPETLSLPEIRDELLRRRFRCEVQLIKCRQQLVHVTKPAHKTNGTPNQLEFVESSELHDPTLQFVLSIQGL